MASLEKTCDVGEGFNPRPDVHATVGHLQSLTIGDTVIAADLRVPRPGSPTPVAVTGVLSAVTWADMAPTTPIELVADVSAANRQMIAAATLAGSAKALVRVAFVVYEYDRVAGATYTSFRSYLGSEPRSTRPGSPSSGPAAQDARPIYGVVRAGDVEVDATPSGAVPGLPTHRFLLRLNPMPAPQAQQLLVQTSTTNKMIRGFGLPQA